MTPRFGGVVAINGVSFTIEERTDLGRVRAERAREATAFNASTRWSRYGVGQFVERAAFGQELLPAAAR